MTLIAQDASIVASDLRGGWHKARARFRAIPMASLPPVALSALLKKLIFLLDSAASQERRSVNEIPQMRPTLAGRMLPVSRSTGHFDIDL